VLKSAADWRTEVRGRTLTISLPSRYRVLSWASLGGGFARADYLVNHQVHENDRAATDAPRRYLTRVVRELGRDPRTAVAIMTGANIRHAGIATARRHGFVVSAWCTAGCSNALRVGDLATVETTKPGTINLIVVTNQAIERSAMVEALQIAVEARVVAMLTARLISTRSEKLATGTGTDCVVIAAPDSAPAHAYCGKHTRLGELIGRASLRACTRALAARGN
jgi:adenosylcobinamide kinase/adenosylcobinamide-phosphate guanylyltransferase